MFRHHGTIRRPVSSNPRKRWESNTLNPGSGCVVANFLWQSDENHLPSSPLSSPGVIHIIMRRNSADRTTTLITPCQLSNSDFPKANNIHNALVIAKSTVPATMRHHWRFDSPMTIYLTFRRYFCQQPTGPQTSPPTKPPNRPAAATGPITAP